ncbi:MAG TPA: DUF3618 domain-containing protein [Streptosporangiaceae bacterium]
MAEGNGEVAVTNPDAMVKEIERTRDDLARTIDELTQRIAPGNVAKRVADRALEQLARPQVQIAGGVALVVIVGVAYLLRRRR